MIFKIYVREQTPSTKLQSMPGSRNGMGVLPEGWAASRPSLMAGREETGGGGYFGPNKLINTVKGYAVAYILLL